MGGLFKQYFLRTEIEKSICFVIPKHVTFSTGGAEIQVHYLTNEFLARGWNVEVVCGGKGNEAVMKKSPYYNGAIHYHYYRFRNFRSFEFLSVFLLLFKTKSTYYYQRTDFALTGACAFFTRITGRKMSYAMAQDRDGLLNKYSTEFKTYQYNSIFKKAIRKWDFYLVDRLIEYAKRHANWIICQNGDQLRLILQNFGKLGHLVYSSFPLDKVEIAEKENIVLWVGNMRPEKKPDLFVDLVEKFSHYKDWRFVMIGKPNKTIVNDIKHRGLSQTCEVLGELTYNEVNHWFAKSAVLINTSSGEGMPNVFIQAWVYKVLIISLSVNPDGVFNNHQCGCFCNDDKSVMAHCLSMIINENNNYESRILEAELFARTRFNIKNNVDKLIALMQNG